VVRTRTTILPAATNAHTLSFPLFRVVIHLDGLYGDASPLADVLENDPDGGIQGPVVARGKMYYLITAHPEVGTSRTPDACGQIPLTPTGLVMRLLLATHLTGSKHPPLGNLSMNNAFCGCARSESASELR